MRKPTSANVEIGVTLRAPRPRRPNKGDWKRCEGGGVGWPTGRALVLALDDGAERTASLLFDDPAPRPLILIPAQEQRRRRLKRVFLLVPDFGGSGGGDESVAAGEAEEEEEDVPISTLTATLPFEVAAAGDGDPSSMDAASLKGCGDALLRSRDYSSAATYYEAALSLTSVLSVGADVVLNRGGRPVVAEVDCIEDEGEGEGESGRRGCAIDVTYLASVGEESQESIVRERDVLLCLSSNDGAGDDDSPSLQERILLNLSRCLLRLAEIDVAGQRALTRPAEYRRAAVLGCTLAMTCSLHRALGKGGGGAGRASSTTEETARLLRASAFSDMPGKSKHAVSDLGQVLKLNPGCTQAKRMVKELKFRDARRKRTDKKLAKEVSRWVQHATDAAEGRGVVSDDEVKNIARVGSSGDDEAQKHLIDTRGTPGVLVSPKIANHLFASIIVVPFVAVVLHHWIL